MAPRLVVEPVGLIALFRILLLHGPRFRPGGRVFNCDHVFKRVWTGTRPAFDQVPVFARSHKVGLGSEVSNIDHKCFALPVTARIAKALADLTWKMRSVVDGNDALPALALSHVIQNRHGSWRLYDTPEAREIWQDRGHAALRHASVLRIIDAIDAGGAVTGRNFIS